MNTVAVSVRNVTKVMGADDEAKVVVEACSFEVERGRFTVLIGPSGCGKTTLINMIAGYDTPTCGEILSDGMQVRHPGPDRLVVFQETMLFPWMTTLKNVMYGPAVQRRRGQNPRPPDTVPARYSIPSRRYAGASRNWPKSHQRSPGGSRWT